MKLSLALALTAVAVAGTRDAGAIPPRRLVEVADLSSPVISPDGRHVAFRVEQANIERDTIVTTWYVQEVDGAAPPLRVSDGGFAMHAFHGLSSPEAAVWSSDGRWIYYRAMVDGRIDVWRAAADGSAAEAVTGSSADVRDFSLDGDGRTLLYSVGPTREAVAAAERAQYEQGVLLDKSVPIGQPLFRSGFIEGRPATQRYRGGRELERVGLLADVKDRWLALDMATGQKRELLSAARQKAASEPVPGKERGAWKWAVDRQRGRTAMLVRSGDGQGLYVQPHSELTVLLDPEGRKSMTCQAGECHNKPITDIQWRPGGDELLFTVTDRDAGSRQSIFRWNVETGTVVPVVQANGLVNGGRDPLSACGVSAHVMVCVAAEADRPPYLERIDIETGERRALFEPNAALAIDIAATTPARRLRWTDGNGQAFSGYFFPARRGSGVAPPLFVNYYQCSGFVRGGTGDEWPLVSLAAQGIAALCINYAPLPLDAVDRYNQGLSAVSSAIELLASAGEIDRSRVGMGGLSLGAEVTLWTLANSDLLTAASVSSPAHTPLTYELRRLYDDTFFPALRTYWQLQAPDATPERWRTLSPVFNLDKMQAPIIMQLPEQEYLQALDYAVPLIEAGFSELYVFPDEAHFKFMPKHRLAVYQRNLDWFKFWLLDQEDPDRSQREQFMRWRQMKAKKIAGLP
ncbi:Atxe2 family lasso peptide isopeptidase [Luteimonas saliphila]|uniref:Atxe2 family lasso peptide isopeptidase n=1 Tax=Luteimonas saliphila TaxID=2804919 RepID=UPI00192E1324|nr:Atxe2 family lasso peptide isopeptidase [Luteimonas saliphila]